MKHKVALIQHYYGTLPNYFPLWLRSAGANPGFTFMIFSDCDFSGCNVPGNVKIISMTFDELKARMAKHLDFEFVCPTPYKACDYRPMYGLIFQDYLEGYDFWGFCDPDIIWGDMNKFVTDDLLSKYGRLYRHGHLEFFRNTERVKTFALHELSYWNISYRDVFRIEQHTAFEECILMEHLFSNFTVDGGGVQYDSSDFADIWFNSFQFRRVEDSGLKETIPAFRWKDGKLFGLSLNGERNNDKEYLYIHLQKRAMKFPPGLENEDSFMIIPNEFVKDHELTQDEIKALMTPVPEYERAMNAKYGPRSKIARIKHFITMNKSHKIFCFKRWLNRLLGRKLSSFWSSRGVTGTYSI